MPVILHSDLNAFYASVECLYRPELKRVPLAVCGDPKKRHGIVLAKNEPAKKMGVKTGEAVWQAERKCPGLRLTAPQGRLYLRYSQLVRSIYEEYTDKVESYGIDECWLDITASGRRGVEVAEELRQRIKEETGLTASIGVSFTKIFAKLGSDLKKPDAVSEISSENFPAIVWPLPVRSLLFIGSRTEAKLLKMNIRTIGDLVRCGPLFLRQQLGKWGLMLWQSAMGLDQDRVAFSGEVVPIKSVGNGMTTIRDLRSENEVKLVFMRLAEKVARRLREQKLCGRTVQITLRDNELVSWERQKKLLKATQAAFIIWQEALSLYKREGCINRPLRSLTVRCTDLCFEAEGRQMSFLPETKREERWLELERSLDRLSERYGEEILMRARLLSDLPLAGLGPCRTDLPLDTLPGSSFASYLQPAKIYRGG